jgi:hypothetical protein
MTPLISLHWWLLSGQQNMADAYVMMIMIMIMMMMMMMQLKSTDCAALEQ